MTECQQVNRNDHVETIRKWGDVNTDGLLEEGCRVFSIPEIEGFIGYKIESSNAVVFGEPVCSPKNKHILAKAFDQECQRLNLGTVYTIVSKEFAEWAAENLSAIMIEFGTKFILDPHHNPMRNTGSKAVLVRKKVKHALKEGVVVKEYLGNDPATEKLIEEVAAAWLANRSGPQIYLSHVTLFKDRYGKRWFYALKDNRVVGLLVLNELQEHKGWLLNNMMQTQDAPKGLSELLVISTLEVLEKEDCQEVLVGPVTLKQLGVISGIGKFGSFLIRLIFNIARFVFHLDGNVTFWDKFQGRMEGTYILLPRNNLTFSSIKALMQAFNIGLKT